MRRVWNVVKGWFTPAPAPTFEEFNSKLKAKAEATEKRADYYEEEVKLRSRLKDANNRIKVSKRAMGFYSWFTRRNLIYGAVTLFLLLIILMVVL